MLKNYNLNLESEDIAKVKEIAIKEGATLSGLARVAIKKWLEERQ